MKRVLYFLLGTAAGSGVTYGLLRKYYNDNFENAVEEVREDYMSRFNGAQSESVEEEKDDTDPSEEYRTESSEVALGENDSISTLRRNRDASHVDYSGYSKESGKAVVEATEEPVDDDYIPSEAIEGVEVETIPPKNRKVYIIAPEEFQKLNGFDKETYTYFEDDEVFMDENEDVVEDGLKRIGKAQINKIGTFDDSVMYVRNETLQIDFEVIIESGSYEEYASRVLGGY